MSPTSRDLLARLAAGPVVCDGAMGTMLYTKGVYLHHCYDEVNLVSPALVEGYFGMPAATVEYFDHPVRYDNAQAAADLAPLGVSCPPFDDYVQRLVAFYLKNVEKITRGAMA